MSSMMNKTLLQKYLFCFALKMICQLANTGIVVKMDKMTDDRRKPETIKT